MISFDKYKAILSNRFLELIIMPTEQCNFRCVYCYEDFSIGKMQADVVLGIKNLLATRIANLDALKISWFGGEPLAAKAIVLDISQYIQSLLTSYPHVHYLAGMTTNAYLLKPMLMQALVKLGISHYQISLDGTEQQHNQTRKRADGGSTFAMIWQNLKAIKQLDLDFEVIIRLHLTPTNLEDIKNLIQLLKNEFAYDKRFKIFFKTIENLGGPNSGTFATLHGQDKQVILQQFTQLLGDQLCSQVLTKSQPYVCYAAQTNSFVIRANGNIGKCTVAFHDDRNALGKLHADGTMSVQTDKFALWTRGVKSLDLKALHCPATQLPALKTKLKSIAIKVQL